MFSKSLMCYLGVLFYQLGEVAEETVLWPQEVELEVSLFPVHQVGKELASIPRYKLGCQLHDVPTTGHFRMTHTLYTVVSYLDFSLLSYIQQVYHNHKVNTDWSPKVANCLSKM